MPRNLCGSLRWSRHRKGGLGHRKGVAPRKLCGSVRWSRHRKDGLGKLGGSVRWSRHRKGALGTGKVVCLENFVAQ